MKHGQVVTDTPEADGSRTITTEGYYEELNSIKVQKRINIPTTQSTIAADVIKCLDVLQAGTHELIIKVTMDKYLYPQMIQKTWVTKKEKI